MVELLVGIACYLTFFGNLGGIGVAMQALALGLLFGAVAYAVILRRIGEFRATYAELVMYTVGIVSLALCVLRGEDTLVVASLGLLIAIIVISILSRVLTLERFLDVGATVALLCVITCIVTERANVVHALSISVGRTGLVRLTPLNNNPNLTGYIFGAGSILMVRRVLLTKSKLERAVMILATLLSWSFILAASARASIIALTGAAIVALLFQFRGSRLMSFQWLSLSFLGCTLFGVVFAAKIGKYLSRILELGSNTRGIGSGGSGRFGLWLRGIAALFDDPITLIFGGGFRSSGSDLIGFSTESSYVTILLDSGLFIGFAVILLFWYSPIKALRLAPSADWQANSLILLPSFLTFLIIESVFNRYLLAIGNPTSLLTLMILFSLSLRGNRRGDRDDARARGPRKLVSGPLA